jgi:hypothetical protein
MKEIARVSILTTVFIYALAFSHFETGVITLEFPAGAENTGLGECGASNANTIYSAFFNPAGIASLYEETYSNFIYSNFHELLLPVFGLKDLYHDYSSFAFSFDKVLPDLDVGFSHYDNFINFGRNTIADSNGMVIDSFLSDERVIANCFAAKVFDIASFGLAVKSYNSRLAPGMGGTSFPKDGIATGNAFDVGLRINKKLRFFDFVNINPAFGISALNLGNDSAKYIDTSNRKDPLPKKCYAGVSCELTFLDFIGFTLIYDVDFYLLHKIHDEWKDRTRHRGHKIQITPFYAVLRGKMDDDIGKRHEHIEGYTLTFNFRKTLDMVSQAIILIDKLNHTNRIERFRKWDGSLSYNGFEFKPNFAISKSHSRITMQEPNHVRDGQTRDDWTIGIGIIGSFPNLLKKNIRQNDNAKDDNSPTEFKGKDSRNSETNEDEIVE